MDEGTTNTVSDEVPMARANGLVGGATLNKPNLSYLEQLAGELSKQAELFNILESKLDVVSERSPQKEPGEQPQDRVHISTMVNILRRHNRRTERIINDLAL